MKRFFVRRSIFISAVFLGFFGLVSGILVSLHFRIFHASTLSSLIGFAIAWKLREPYLSITSENITSRRNLSKYDFISRKEIINTESNFRKILVETEKQKYTIALFLFSKRQKREIIQELQNYNKYSP